MSVFTIAKTFHFAASHQLSGLGPDHQCARLHGHNYEVALELTGPLDDNCMVFDYGRLAPFADFINTTLDHRHLNEVMDDPTAESLAEYLYEAAEALLEDVLPGEVLIAAVRVMETPRSVAEYRP